MKNHVQQQLAHTSGMIACTQCKPVTRDSSFLPLILIYYVVCPFLSVHKLYVEVYYSKSSHSFLNLPATGTLAAFVH